MKLWLSPDFTYKGLDNSQGLNLLAGAQTGWTVQSPIALLYYTIPDQTHLDFIREELTRGSGVLTFPFKSFFGSMQKTQTSQSSSDDISYSGSLIEKTYVTWVNYGTFTQDPAVDSNELVIGQGGPVIENAGARYMPLINSLEVKIDGKQYPWAGGLNTSEPEFLKAYTEYIEGIKCGVGIDKYKSYRFYTVFDYTGHQNIFLVPNIMVQSGELVNSRFINLLVKFTNSPQAGSEPKCMVYHLAQKMIKFMPNLSMQIIE